MKRMIRANSYDYDRLIVYDDWTEEDELTVNDAIEGMAYQAYENYSDEVSLEDAVEIVNEHLEEIYGLKRNVDFGVDRVRDECMQYDWVEEEPDYTSEDFVHDAIEDAVYDVCNDVNLYGDHTFDELAEVIKDRLANAPFNLVEGEDYSMDQVYNEMSDYDIFQESGNS